MSDTVSIEAGSKKVSGWSGITIERSLDSIAHVFSLSAPNDTENQFCKPFGYEPCKVFIDDEKILTGRIEMRNPTINSNSKMLNIQGRSLAGSAVDCQIDSDGSPFVFENLTLSGIATQILSPFGISVIAYADSDPIEEVSAEPGEFAGAFLSRLALDTGLNITSENDGRVAISRTSSRLAPIQAIEEGAGNFLSAKATYDGTKRFSKIKCYSQQFGDISEGISTDSGVSIYRPRVEVGINIDAADIQTTAKWKTAVSLSESAVFTVSLSGWRANSGFIWYPGATITLKSPAIDLFEPILLVISRVILTLDKENGRTCALGLSLPQAYTGDLSGVYRW